MDLIIVVVLLVIIFGGGMNWLSPLFAAVFLWLHGRDR